MAEMSSTEVCSLFVRYFRCVIKKPIMYHWHQDLRLHYGTLPHGGDVFYGGVFDLFSMFSLCLVLLYIIWLSLFCLLGFWVSAFCFHCVSSIVDGVWGSLVFGLFGLWALWFLAVSAVYVWWSCQSIHSSVQTVQCQLSLTHSSMSKKRTRRGTENHQRKLLTLRQTFRGSATGQSASGLEERQNITNQTQCITT